uniref:hypothetical protein n=1 Tax=Oribacterium parvum TaxID=1501329 RepID=UPI0028DB2FEC
INTMRSNNMSENTMSENTTSTNTMSGNTTGAYRADLKWKNGIEKKALIALCSFSLLSLSVFPSFAENANNNVESGTNHTVSGDANAWNLEDNSISFFEVPELVNHYSSIAELEKNLISQSTKGMEGVKSAVKEQKEDIVDALSDNISLLKDQRDNTEDKTVKEALGKEIAKLEKVKNSKKILPGLDSSLVEANYALTELAKTDKEMTKAEKKTEKSIRSQFLTGKALLSDAMQNLLFSYMQTENTRKMLEKRVSLMERSLNKVRKEESLGKATGNDVAAAELSLKSAEADLNKLRDGMDTMRRNIGLSLGWHMNTYQNITIEGIPDFPREYLNGRNQETDYQAVLARNSEYGEILREKEKNITGWTEKKQKEREKSEEIRSAVKNLWATVEEKELALKMAETNASLSQLKKDRAARMEAQGLISRVDAEGMELDALNSENAYENARLDYNQAVFRYEEAVNKGILSLE